MVKVKSSRKASDQIFVQMFKNKVEKVLKVEEVMNEKVIHSSIDMKSEITVECETEKISFWTRNRWLIFEAMKSIQILVCLAYCLFFVMAVISKKEWLNAYHDNIRLQIYGLSIYWYESGVYFFISGIGLVGAVGEVLCCCILYSIFHTIAIPYCIIPWFVTIGIYNGWGWTQMYSTLMFAITSTN